MKAEESVVFEQLALVLLCFDALALFHHSGIAMTSTGKAMPSPLVVMGSANADIYLEIARMPKEGETVSARNGQTLPGGKGANQAACAARLSYPTYFVGQVRLCPRATLLLFHVQLAASFLLKLMDEVHEA